MQQLQKVRQRSWEGQGQVCQVPGLLINPLLPLKMWVQLLLASKHTFVLWLKTFNNQPQLDITTMCLGRGRDETRCPIPQVSSEKTPIPPPPWVPRIPVDESVTIPDVEPFDSAQDLDCCQAEMQWG